MPPSTERLGGGGRLHPQRARQRVATPLVLAARGGAIAATGQEPHPGPVGRFEGPIDGQRTLGEREPRLRVDLRRQRLEACAEGLGRSR